MNNIENYSSNLFEKIKHVDELGQEYWLARELQVVLEYRQWRRFKELIDKAIISCNSSNNNYINHFANVGKMVNIGSKTKRKLEDYKLSRYACYLIVQNGDPRKEVIALGQTYFAYQTRKQELFEELNEDKKRLEIRNKVRKGNLGLNQTADKLKRDKVDNEYKDNSTHLEIGKKVRKAIMDMGGTMPENFPTPNKSINELENNNISRR